MFFFGGCETRSRDSTTAEKVSVLQNLRVLRLVHGMVRAAISSFVMESKFSEGSDAGRCFKKEMTDFLQELSDDIRLTVFDSFAEALLQLLEKHLDTACGGCIRSRNVLKEKAWIAFHQLRIDELPKKWSQFTPQLRPSK